MGNGNSSLFFMGRVDFAGFMSRTFKILQIAFDFLLKENNWEAAHVLAIARSPKNALILKKLKIQNRFSFFKIGKLDVRYVDIKAKPHRLDGFVLFA